MDWNITQNFSSNIVFGILLFAMIIYWVSFSLFKETKNIIQIGKLSAIIANLLLFFILCSRWIVAGYFPLSNLYESLLFLTWILLTIYLYLEFKTKSKLLGAILLPIALLINGFANLTLSAEMQKSSPLVPALQSNWLMMHVSMMMLSYATLIIGSLERCCSSPFLRLGKKSQHADVDWPLSFPPWTIEKVSSMRDLRLRIHWFLCVTSPILFVFHQAFLRS